MATLNTKTTLVCAGLAVCSLLLAPAAQAQDVSFIPHRDFAVGDLPFSVAVGDFNGDGRLDLVTANVNAYNVSVLLGDGDGGFQPARTFATGEEPYSVAVGDFNGDGWLDLAVANFGTANVSVLLGNGDGSF